MTAATLDGRVFEPPPLRPPWLRPVVVVIVIALHAAALSIVYLEPKPVEPPREVVVDIEPEAPPAEAPAPAAEQPKPPEKSAAEPPPVARAASRAAAGATSASPAGVSAAGARAASRRRLRRSNRRFPRRRFRRRSPSSLPRRRPRRSLRFPRRGLSRLPLRSSLRRLLLRSRSRPRRPSLVRPCARSAETRGATGAEAGQTCRDPASEESRSAAQGAARRSFDQRARERRLAFGLYWRGERHHPQSPLLSARRARPGREGSCRRFIRHRPVRRGDLVRDHAILRRQRPRRGGSRPRAGVSLSRAPRRFGPHRDELQLCPPLAPG